MHPQRQQFLLFRIRVFKDHASFEELHKDFSERLYRFLRSRLPTESDTDDAVSLTLWRLWNYLTVSQVEHFSGLLFTIARGVVAEHYRTRKDDAPLEAALAEGKEPQAMDSEGKIVATTELELLKRVIKRLPKETREVIEWRYFEGMPADEIAQRIGKTVNATRVMIHRAMKLLREELANEQYDRT